MPRQEMGGIGRLGASVGIATLGLVLGGLTPRIASAHPRDDDPAHNRAARQDAHRLLHSVGAADPRRGDNLNVRTTDALGRELGSTVTVRGLGGARRVVEAHKGDASPASLRVDDGRVRIDVRRGFEYYPETAVLDVGRDGEAAHLVLRRVVDIPALGWWSGDVHVHLDRASPEADASLMALAQSNDLHVMNLLEMGSATALSYPQYAYGAAGQVSDGDHWLVTGQEDPRTSLLGHVIVLNATGLIRDADAYYLYDNVFDEAHEQGGIVGLAHFYEAFFMGEQQLGTFSRQRPGHNLHIFDGQVDFIEIINGDNPFDPLLYFEVLNLGVEVPVAAGSDIPFAPTSTLGDDRTYVYIGPGEALTPQKWFDGLEAGRSYFTEGPLIEEFTVDAELVGSTIELASAASVSVRATVTGAEALGASPQRIEVISFGDTLLSATSVDPSQETLSIDDTLTVDANTWLVLRVESHAGRSAITSPIYVKVCDQPSVAPPEMLEDQIALRLENLEIARNRINEVPEDQQDAVLERIGSAESHLADLLRPPGDECPPFPSGTGTGTGTGTGDSAGTTGPGSSDSSPSGVTTDTSAGATTPSGGSSAAASGGSTTDATGEASTGDQGCGCRGPGGPTPGRLALGLLAVLLVRRKRP